MASARVLCVQPIAFGCVPCSCRGGQHDPCHGRGLRRLRWLVCRDGALSTRSQELDAYVVTALRVRGRCADAQRLRAATRRGLFSATPRLRRPGRDAWMRTRYAKDEHARACAGVRAPSHCASLEGSRPGQQLRPMRLLLGEQRPAALLGLELCYQQSCCLRTCCACAVARVAASRAALSSVERFSSSELHLAGSGTCSSCRQCYKALMYSPRCGIASGKATLFRASPLPKPPTAARPRI